MNPVLMDRGGRPKKLDDKQRTLAVELYQQGKHTAYEICRTLGITRPTLYAYVNAAKDNEPNSIAHMSAE